MNMIPIDFKTSPIKVIFRHFALPAVVAMVAQNAASLINALFIGHYVGPEGLSAVSLIMPILMLLSGLAVMLGTGGITQAGIALGRNAPEESNHYFNLTFFSLVIIGVTATGIIQIGIPWFARLTGADGITAEYTVIYGRTVGLFALFFIMNTALGFFLKLDGRPRLVVVTLLIGTVANIFLDWLLVGRFGMALRGAALATGISLLIPWLILLTAVIRISRWKIQLPRFSRQKLRNMCFNGLSELLSIMAFSIRGMILNGLLMHRLGTGGVAAFAVTLQYSGLVAAVGHGLGESCQTALSFNFGAKQYDRVKGFLRHTLKITLICGVLLFAVAVGLRHQLVSFFIASAETSALAAEMLFSYSFAFLFICSNIAVGAYYTAIDDPVSSAGLSLYRALLGVLAGLAILPAVFGSAGIWYAIIFSEVSTFLISMLLLRRIPLGRRKPLEALAASKAVSAEEVPPAGNRLPEVSDS